MHIIDDRGEPISCESGTRGLTYPSGKSQLNFLKKKRKKSESSQHPQDINMDMPFLYLERVLCKDNVPFYAP